MSKLFLFILTLSIFTVVFIGYHYLAFYWKKILSLFKPKGVAKVNFKKLHLDVNECDVLGSEYIKEKPEYSTTYSFLSRESYSAKMINENVSGCYIYCKSSKRYTSGMIYKSKESVILKLANQKKLTIYINENNEDDYFFDLNFLEDENA